MIRAFLAIELNQQIRSALQDFQDRIRNHLPPISWIKPESMHVTVRFLGDIEEVQVAPIHQAVEQALEEISSFSLHIKGIGGFPNLTLPRVLWAGVSGQVDELQILVSNVEHALGSLGFSSESKSFRGHLSLARIKQRSREVGMALHRSQVLGTMPHFGTLTVQQLCLFKSELKPSGAVYHRLWEVHLKEP